MVESKTRICLSLELTLEFEVALMYAIKNVSDTQQMSEIQQGDFYLNSVQIIHR